MANERIKSDMTVPDMVLAMSDGNHGAADVCMQLMESGQEIDPDSLHGGFTNIVKLDTLGIYGERIWMLYSNVCGHHLGKMIAVLRASQLGLLTTQTLNQAINRGQGLDLDAVVEAVKNRLPNFRLEAVAS